MKYKGIYWALFAPMIKKSITNRFGEDLADKAIRDGKAEYRRLLSRADDLGPGNPMAMNAYFAYVFAAAWLGSGRKITPDKMALVMTDVLESKLLRTFFGMTDLNRTPKKWEQEMRKYEAWFAKHGKDYPVNWNVSFDETRHKEGSFYYFTRCPICEFCNREGIGELMPALCSTDEVMFRLQHGKLHREHTIAVGDPVCDYWITGDKIKASEAGDPGTRPRLDVPCLSDCGADCGGACSPVRIERMETTLPKEKETLYMDLQFGDIQETALITLAVRASETARPNARIRDEKAKEIIDALGVDVSRFDPFISHEGVVARTIMYRDQLKELIGKYPESVCINLGCGFDDKFSQVDNGVIQWFDVDLPDQIAVRRKVYEDRERCVMMDGDALDGTWTKNIPKADMYLIMMEGVLEYFSKAQVKTCLNMLCDSFPHGYLLAELHPPFIEKHAKHHDAVKHTNATYGWGTKSGKEYLDLEPRMKLISERSYNEEMKKYSLRGKLFAVIGKNWNNRLAVFIW